jgi:hypothetical protein
MTFAVAAVVDVALVRAVMANAGIFAGWVVAHLLFGGVLGAVLAETAGDELPSPMSRFGPRRF